MAPPKPLPKKNRRIRLVLILLVVSVVFAGVIAKGIQFWWYYGYSKGQRTGVVRKVSVKGPPFCKYLSGEMVLQGTGPGMPIEVWEFSVDDSSDANPVVLALREAEKRGDRVTVQYRQDLHSMYRCTPSEYFVTKVEK